MTGAGALRKMRVSLLDTSVDSDANAFYELMVGDRCLALNALVGKKITLSYRGAINCVHCGRKTSKSFNQGFCYPCFKSLAQCDRCIVSPETCHYHEGTCREPEWGEQHCMTGHYVYLANSSGLKVGITRGSQIPTRWIDQGAVQALPIYYVASRYLSGLVETLYKHHAADKTNWRAMLKGDPEPVDLQREAELLAKKVAPGIEALQREHGLQSVQRCDDAEQVLIRYPVQCHPEKVTSLNFDKTPDVSGELMGIKGQYLLLDSGVINMRKFAGYDVEVDIA